MGKAQKTVRSSSARMQRSLQKFGKSVKGAIKSITSLRGALVALGAVTALGLLVKKAIDAADSIAKVADSVGLSTDSLQEYRFVADLAGVATEQFDKSVQKFSRNMGDLRANTGTLVTFLQKYDQGLLQTLKDTDDTDVAFKLFVKRLADTANIMDRAALATAGFGRQGISMAIIVRDGSAAMEGIIKQARALGIILEEELLRKAEAAKDAISIMTTVLGVNFTRAALELLPAVRALTDAFADPAFAQSIRSLGQTVAQLIVFFIKFHPEILAVTSGLLAFSFASKATGPKVAALIGVLTALAVEGFGRLGKSAADTDQAVAAFKKTVEDLGAGGGPVEGSKIQVVSLKKALDDLRFSVEVAEGRFGPFSAQALKAARSVGAFDEESRQFKAGAKGFNEALLALEIAYNRLAAAQAQQDLVKDRAKESMELTFKNKEAVDEWADASRDAANTLESAFEAAVIRGENLRGVLKSLLEDLAQLILRIGFTQPLAGAVGAGINALAGILSGFAGGGGAGTNFTQGSTAGNFPANALGGRVDGPSLVGERGPELFFPDRPGIILPNSALRETGRGNGGPSIVQQFNVSPGVAETVRREMLVLLPFFREQAIAAVAEAADRGGPLSKKLGRG